MRFLIVFAVVLIGCQTLIPRVNFGIKDLTGIKTYNVIIECDSIPDSFKEDITVCDGGIKNGNFYCHNLEYFDCEPGRAILLSGFDSSSFPKLDAYIEYLVERFKQK